MLVQAPLDGAGEASCDIELFFRFVSAAIVSEAATGSLADVGRERERAADFEMRISRALDLDLEAWLGEAKQSSSTQHLRAVRMLEAWTKKPAESRQVLLAQVLDATLDPLTWRTVTDDVGATPSVSVLLFLPGSFAQATTNKPLSDIDLAMVYHGSPLAAEGIEHLANAMTPTVSPPPPPVVLQARRNAEARIALLTEFGALTAVQVAALTGSEARNRSALAGRWRREGRLVAVDHHGTNYYPGFQFNVDGQPRPVVAEVLQHLADPTTTSWQQALWFTTANGWLDGRRPVDLLDDEPEALVAAAREALREPVG